MPKSTVAAPLDTQAKDNSGAIRKYTRAVIFAAPLDAEPVENITTMGPNDRVTLAKVPDKYSPIGLIKKSEGIEFSAERDTSETESLGYAAPTRTDITKETSSLAFTPHEEKKLVEQLYYGLDLSDVEPDPDTGEVSFAKPTLPATIYYRILVVGVDGAGDNEFFKGWFIPRGQITETDSTGMSAEDESAYPMTLTATPDSALGFSVKVLKGGSGFKKSLVDLGWAEESTGGNGGGNGGSGGGEGAEGQSLAAATDRPALEQPDEQTTELLDTDEDTEDDTDTGDTDAE